MDKYTVRNSNGEVEENEELLDSVKISITGFQESRLIETMKNEDGVFIDAHPVSGSENAMLDLRLPNGHVIAAQISHADFVDYVMPLFSKPRQ